MTTTEYWRREISKASEVAPPSPMGGVEDKDPQIMAALMMASQLHTITSLLSEIRVQLEKIEDSIANN